MSHLIEIYNVCKIIFFCLLRLKELSRQCFEQSGLGGQIIQSNMVLPGFMLNVKGRFLS